MANLITTTSPKEPPEFTRLRDAYWARRRHVNELEHRITRTDRGLDWLARVKQIGRP